MTGKLVGLADKSRACEKHLADTLVKLTEAHGNKYAALVFTVVEHQRLLQLVSTLLQMLELNGVDLPQEMKDSAIDTCSKCAGLAVLAGLDCRVITLEGNIDPQPTDEEAKTMSNIIDAGNKLSHECQMLIISAVKRGVAQVVNDDGIEPSDITIENGPQVH